MLFKQQFMVTMSYDRLSDVTEARHTQLWLNAVLRRFRDHGKREFTVEHLAQDPRDNARDLCEVAKDLFRERDALRRAFIPDLRCKCCDKPATAWFDWDNDDSVMLSDIELRDDGSVHRFGEIIYCGPCNLAQCSCWLKNEEKEEK